MIRNGFVLAVPKTTIDLDLKFLVHYGELTIKSKILLPYGREVIQIHRLLKNQIPVQECFIYWEHVYVVSGQYDRKLDKKTEIYDLQKLIISTKF
jgi:hypothetical protein